MIRKIEETRKGLHDLYKEMVAQEMFLFRGNIPEDMEDPQKIPFFILYRSRIGPEPAPQMVLVKFVHTGMPFDIHSHVHAEGRTGLAAVEQFVTAGPDYPGERDLENGGKGLIGIKNPPLPIEDHHPIREKIQDLGNKRIFH